MKRVLLLDRDEVKDFARYVMKYSALSVQDLEFMLEDDPVKFKSLMSFGPGDAIMLWGSKAFTFIKQYYHLGIRSENYWDCAKLRRVSMEGGAYAKVIVEPPTDEELRDFGSRSFTTKVEFNGLNAGIISTYGEAIEFLKFLQTQPLSDYFGFDYEGSGFPMDRWYELSGFSLSTESIVRFISLTDIRHELGGSDNESYRTLLAVLGQFLVDRQDHIVVYHMQYEWQASHRMLGVDLYNLVDASVVNVLDGFHEKKYSLKWTGQRVLSVDVWDAEFDRISDLVDQMLFTEEGKLKKDKRKVLRVDPGNFEATEEWGILCSRYPDYIDEFRSLILEYWGNPFMCIPSKILGYYCNLDAFYTLQIFLTKKKEYSDECINVFLDNIRLGCRLMSSGLYIDEPFRAKYDHYCRQMMAWGITYCAMARCWIKMEKHKANANNIKRYNSTAQKLLRENQFYQGNAVEIVKNLMARFIDQNDTTETGLDEGRLMMTYGPKFAEKFVEIVKESMIEVKMKGKIDSGIVRKKKILNIIAEKSIHLLGLDAVKLGNKHIELEKYIYYETAFNELSKVTYKQLTDINNIPDKLYFFGKYWDLLEYSDYVSDNYFKCKSPLENDEIIYDMTMLFRSQTAFLGALSESTQQLPNTDKFYSSREITDINEAFQEFMCAWELNYRTGERDSLYPQKMFTLALEFFQCPKKTKDPKKSTEEKTEYIYGTADKVKEIWTDFVGFNAQTTYFPAYKDQFIEYSKPFRPETEADDVFFFMRKFTINYLLYKKYAKMYSTYVGPDGMFKKNNKYVIVDEHHLPIKEVDPDEPGAVELCLVRYEVLSKSSKRWSSAFHTIISHSDCKNVLCPPPTRDENGNIVYGGSDQMLTYFDISSAEVKAAGFSSLDRGLISKFSAGEDIYIYSTKLYLGEEGWNSLSKEQQKAWRKKFKTVFLGVLYGLGKNSLAERLECSLEEAERIIQSLYTSFPGLREYVDKQGQYPLDHDGYINTFLGDKLRLREFYDYLPKATSDYERKNIIARIKRLGVNLPIQGGTSSIMACGFFNNIRQSIKEGWDQPLQPIIVVHDSNTNYIPVEKIFDIRHFYDVNYTDFCASFGPRIKLLFDLLAGYSYESAKEMKTRNNEIEFTGDATSLMMIRNKIMSCPKLNVECSMSVEELIASRQIITDPIDRFIKENGCCMDKDVSKVTIKFRKLN